MRNTLLATAAVATFFALTACDVANNTTGSTTTSDGKKTVAVKTANASKFSKAQQEAIDSAKQYLSTQAFSKAGLIDQLSSKAGDGFPAKVATFAVNHLDVDWNHQAYLSAKQYLSLESFSKANLIQQLESGAGDKFTHAQAVYGAAKAYADQ